MATGSLVPRRVDPAYGGPVGRTPLTPDLTGGFDPTGALNMPPGPPNLGPASIVGNPSGASRDERPYQAYQASEMKEPAWMEEMRQMVAGGGGMGGYAPPAPPQIDEDLESRALQAALNRISAEYGIRIAEPQNALNSLGGGYRMAMQQNSRQFGDAERSQNSQIAGRGLLRSGVRNTEMQRAFDPIESQRREIQNTMAYGEGVEEKDYGTQALSLQAAIEQLRAAQGNAELERRLEAERSGLSHGLAVANPGG